jgi:hypothetical protein
MLFVRLGNFAVEKLDLNFRVENQELKKILNQKDY